MAMLSTTTMGPDSKARVPDDNVSTWLTADAAATPAYTVAARLLHWITAVLVLLMIPLGVAIANEWGGPLEDSLYDLHKSLGATLIPIVVLRLLYRWRHPPVPLPNDINSIQRLVAGATHWALYALLLLQPMIGWIATSAYPAPIPLFGLSELPRIWTENRALSDQLFVLHGWLAMTITCLLGAHVAAALFHHFVRKDRVLMRMITG
jgi:cytochrome b561